MGKSSKKRNQAANIIELAANEKLRNYIITSAALKDDFCHYGLEIIEGIGIGDCGIIKGSGIIKEDLRHAFGRLNVHLAAIDDVFKHSKIEIEDIDKLHTDDLTSMYNVTGIIVKGNRDNESVILVGNKYISSAGGRIEIKTPKIALDHMSSYKWYNELKAAVDVIRHEVALYKEGKYTPVETEEEENPNQLTISAMIISNKRGEGAAEGDDDDLESHKI